MYIMALKCEKCGSHDTHAELDKARCVVCGHQSSYGPKAADKKKK